jgi:hypothetical protein
MHSASKKLGGGNGMCKGDCCCNNKTCYGPGCGHHLHVSAFILSSIIIAIVFALLITTYEVSESRMTDMSSALVNLSQRMWVVEHHVSSTAGPAAAAKTSLKNLSLLPVVSLENAIPSDGRTLISAPTGSCPQSLMGDPTELVTYTNRTAGLTLAVPYNPAWGTDTTYMTPYDQTASGIAFGGNVKSQGCRSFQMDIVPHVTADTIQKNALSSVSAQNVETKTIGDWQVVVTHTSDLCSSVNMEVIGRLHNFRFSSNCDDSQNAVNMLTNVIESMHRLQY